MPSSVMNRANRVRAATTLVCLPTTACYPVRNEFSAALSAPSRWLWGGATICCGE